MRLAEGLRLRVKDIDFEQHHILVRDGKGEKDRVTLLPDTLLDDLQAQPAHARRLHEEDLTQGLGAVYLPYALSRKYPNAEREWSWQYAFPSHRLSTSQAQIQFAAITWIQADCKRRFAMQPNQLAWPASWPPYVAPLLRHPPSRKWL